MHTLITRALQRASAARDDSGQALAEYGLVLALVAVVAIATVAALGLAIVAQLAGIGAAL